MVEQPLLQKDATMKFSGKKLRAIRQQSEMTQSELSEISGVSQSLISKYEREEVVNPPLSVIKPLANALGKHPDDFYLEQEPQRLGGEHTTVDLNLNIYLHVVDGTQRVYKGYYK